MLLEDIPLATHTHLRRVGAVATVLCASLMASAPSRAQTWNSQPCPIALSITYTQLRALGILSDPECVYLPGNLSVQISAEREGEAGHEVSIVVAVPANVPGGYVSRVLRPYSSDPSERSMVLSIASPEQVLFEFHEHLKSGRDIIWSQGSSKGKPTQSNGTFESVSRNMGLAFTWPTAQAGTGPLTANLVINTMCSDKTTELGADEVYVLAIGRRTDGATYSQRQPADAPNQPQGHWDMNDGNQPTDNPNGDAHCRTNKTLFTGSLTPGQSWDLHIAFMEEDNGSSKTFQQVAAQVLAQIDNPVTVAAAAVLDVLNALGFWINDSDDYLGSIGVHIENVGGTLTATWNPKERIVHSIPDPSDPGNTLKREVRMNGDGSNYVVWLGVR